LTNILITSRLPPSLLHFKVTNSNCSCAHIIPAHRERKTITRRKKETDREEKIGRSGESKDQGTGTMSSMCCTLFALTGKAVRQTTNLVEN